MRVFVLGAFALATIAIEASAQVTFSSQLGAPDPGPLGTETVIVDFNDPTPLATYALQGITFDGNYSFLTGSIGGRAAEPADPLTPRGFWSVPNINDPDANGYAIIDFSGYLQTQVVSSLSFYWGSIDQYNKLEVLNSQGQAIAVAGFGMDITGGDVFAQANGNQTMPETNRRIFLDLSNVDDFAALKFTSTSFAFEIDDIAVSIGDPATVVPEPATVTILAFGLGVLGVVGARRKRNAA